ncbi:MAG: hypothetical protein A3D31_07420 [Candidatus Fluviicola riflensis]|nr:MAG: hypothetical protein CHH17_07590 [Candidatus Fluviicola riflensis]OGS79776.1 MAG: hypothetical protein A3D31_07420 [Candidatus Fluviicola riflensis]OGS87209.1 MAG: hypothetical protein A2724_06880 [Fluviicola sp. RIFCSPHIGHO2_01_FULL_43_53]OGS89997.1 MAG: hypothetical protein A3E30_03625 [Fluviicola sp. RIFCSPHIGHO2_12_FULL_43_24]
MVDKLLVIEERCGAFSTQRHNAFAVALAKEQRKDKFDLLEEHKGNQVERLCDLNTSILQKKWCLCAFAEATA